MDDHIWVTVLALSLVNFETVGLVSMLVGAVCVFVPQMAMAWFPPHRTLGGADIKLSTALAFLLGSWKGIAAYLIGLVLAVLFIGIYRKVTHRTGERAFALIPFLSIGALTVFLI